MSDNFIGEIRMFGGNFAIKNWAFCNGQFMNISQNSALFSLIGTTYGGNGVQTFALPDLRGRIPVGQGQGPGLTNRTIGENGGSENVLLSLNQIPIHSHTFNATRDNATLANVDSNTLPATPTVANAKFYAVPGASPNTQDQLAPTVVGNNPSSNLPHNNIMPSLCLTFIIALTGIFPSRN
jgi:microcystin-dependent protein